VRLLPLHEAPGKTHRYTASIVLDLQHLETSFLELDSYHCRARIETVLHHLFERIRRPMNDLTRCDLVDHMLGKTLSRVGREGGMVKREDMAQRSALPRPSHLDNSMLDPISLLHDRRRVTAPSPECAIALRRCDSSESEV
jgi:hypothetical protein